MNGRCSRLEGFRSALDNVGKKPGDVEEVVGG